MIITITGAITYPITLDPTVWIFDDRKLLFPDSNEEVYSKTDTNTKTSIIQNKKDYREKTKPYTTESTKKYSKHELLQNSYLMPIKDFINRADVHSSVEIAKLTTNQGDIFMPIDQLKNCLALFSLKGKPIKEDGPIYLYKANDTNYKHPLKGITNIHMIEKS